MNLPELPGGHAPRAALFWCGFNLRRNLRKRAFWMWGAGVLAMLGILLGTHAMRSDALGRLFILLVTPLLALFFATGVVREEIEDQTLTYPFSRPVGRAWLYTARVLAAIIPVALLIVPVGFIAGADVGPATALRFLLATLLGTLAYGTLFALVGQLLRWPTWIGLVYLIFWEGMVSMVPGFLGRLTLQAHLRSVGDLGIGDGPWKGFWEAPPAALSITVLVSVTLISLWLGGWFIRRREHVLTR